MAYFRPTLVPESGRLVAMDLSVKTILRAIVLLLQGLRHLSVVAILECVHPCHSSSSNAKDRGYKPH